MRGETGPTRRLHRLTDKIAGSRKSHRHTEVASVSCKLHETTKLNELDPADDLVRAALVERRSEALLPLA